MTICGVDVSRMHGNVMYLYAPLAVSLYCGNKRKFKILGYSVGVGGPQLLWALSQSEFKEVSKVKLQCAIHVFMITIAH